MEETLQNKTRCIAAQDREYPERLGKLTGMPKKLYVKGRMPRDELPAIAIVGARMCSSYGRVQAYQYARYFSRAGIQVISGLAMGIDLEAHKGAMDGGTPTFAVLGSGPDLCYPAANRTYYRKIQEMGGGILSEYPARTPPAAWHFPARNRIISGLADVVLVIEAREKSGALITVDFALEQGKSVYALPGPVDSPLSLGCHKLLRDGAGVAFSPEEVLKEWDPDTYKVDTTGKKTKIRLATEWDLVYSNLDLQPRSLESLAVSLDMPVAKVLKILADLEIKGLIREVGKNYYIKWERTPGSMSEQ